MNMKKISLFLCCIFIGLSSVIPVYGVENTTSTYSDSIINGQTVFEKSNVIFIPAENTLITGLIDSNGEISELGQELTLDDRIYTVALADSYLYLGTSKGLNRVDLSQEQTDTSLSELITDNDMYDGFQLYDGYAYYPYISSVYRSSLTTGEKTCIIESAEDYQLTAQGIYFITEGGRFCYTDFDGKITENLGDFEPGATLNLFQSELYISGTSLAVYNLDDKTLKSVPLSHTLNTYYDVIPMQDYILFTGDDYNTYKYEFSTGMETLIHTASLPDKNSRIIINNHMYYSYGTGDIFTMNMADYQNDKFALADKISSSSVNSYLNEEPVSDSDYNIAQGLTANTSDGLAYLNTDHIGIYFNTQDYANGLWTWEVIDNSTIAFYYSKAHEAGYGGHVFTIKSYDWGDNSYSDFPDYQIAGLSSDKKYIAIYPTDVQYDPSDSVQSQEYNSLLTFARRIDENNETNPFYVVQ